jgi:hypothetical protein
LGELVVMSLKRHFLNGECCLIIDCETGFVMTCVVGTKIVSFAHGIFPCFSFCGIK